jgi:hypothetical protein
MLLGFYKDSKTGMRKTRLKKGDVIGYNASQASQSIKIFRPTKGGLVRLAFKEGSDFSKDFRWPLKKEEVKLLANLMAASVGCNGAFQISCAKYVDLTWAYQID